MVDQTTAPNTVPNSDKADAAPRTEGRDRMALLRGKLSVEQHAALLAAQTCVEEAERNLAASRTRITEMEATASKAATVEGTQQHELALIDRKHSLMLEQQRQQWALDDARKERDRNLVESERERTGAAETRRVAEVRQQCDTISQQNVELHAAISQEEQRIAVSSMVAGGIVGVIFGLILGTSQKQRRGTSRGASGLIGAGGALSVAAPLIAPYLKPTPHQLPTPLISTEWNSHLMTLIEDNARLRSQLATLQTKTLSMSTTAASALGGGAITYALASRRNDHPHDGPSGRRRTKHSRASTVRKRNAKDRVS